MRRKMYRGPGVIKTEFGIPLDYDLKQPPRPIVEDFRVLDNDYGHMDTVLVHGYRGHPEQIWGVTARPARFTDRKEIFGQLVLAAETPPDAVLTEAHKWISSSPATRLVSTEILEVRSGEALVNQLGGEARKLIFRGHPREISIAGLMLVAAGPRRGAELTVQ